MDPVFVLAVKIERTLADFGGDVQLGLAVLAHVAQQEAGPLLLKRLVSIGICAKERELPVAGIRARVILVFLVTVITEAVLHGVVAMDPREIIEPVVIAILIYIWTKAKESGSIAVLEVQVWNSLQRRGKWQRDCGSHIRRICKRVEANGRGKQRAIRPGISDFIEQAR